MRDRQIAVVLGTVDSVWGGDTGRHRLAVRAHVVSNALGTNGGQGWQGRWGRLGKASNARKGVDGKHEPFLKKGGSIIQFEFWENPVAIC